LPVITEPNEELAVRTERSTSAEVDLIRELTSLEVAISTFCEFSVLVWMLSALLAAAALSARSISEEIVLIWVAASAEVAVSELCASRALLRMEAAVSAPTAERVRSTSAASDLT